MAERTTMEHHPERNRFEQPVDEGTAYVEYEELGSGALDLQHTIVPRDAQGRGVGSDLVEAVMRYARDNGLRVVPSCPFVGHWLEKHPEYGDLVTER